MLAYDKTEDGNTSDIRIKYSSDVSNVETIIYDQNLRNDGDNQANPPWKNVNILYIIFTYYIDDFITLLLYYLLYILW